jgi:hypothetical protein
MGPTRGVTFVTVFQMDRAHNQNRLQTGPIAASALHGMSTFVLAGVSPETGSSMTGRAMETSKLDPFPIPMTMSGHAAAALPAAIPAPSEECAADEAPSVAGCLRGLRWGLAIEGAAALAIYGAWRLLLILR